MHTTAGIVREDDRSTAPVEPHSLADLVRDALLVRLTSGELKPGDRVNEAMLARTFGISRNPIREAVASLAARGYLTAAPRRGHFIRTFERADIDSLFAFRITLEMAALAAAMARSSLAERASLRRIVDAMVAHAEAGRVADVHGADVAFHRRICELAGNRYLLAAHEAIDCEVRMLIAAVKLDRESPVESARNHRPIVEAIVSGDAAAAAAALEAHISATRCHVLASFPLVADPRRPARSRRGAAKETA